MPMIQFIAQATQPAGGFANFTAAEWIGVITAVVAGITSIIVAVRAGNKATEANTKADANSVRLNQHGDHIYDLALGQPADPSAAATVRAKASTTEGTTTP